MFWTIDVMYKKDYGKWVNWSINETADTIEGQISQILKEIGENIVEIRISKQAEQI